MSEGKETEAVHRDRERPRGGMTNPRATAPAPPARSPLTSWKSACPAGPAAGAGAGAGGRGGSGAGGRIRHTVSNPAHAMVPPPAWLRLGCGSGALDAAATAAAADLGGRAGGAPARRRRRGG